MIRAEVGQYVEIDKLKTFWGRQDSGAAVERALLLHELIPGAEVHVFDRAAHWVQWDQAERFNSLVRDFLRAKIP